MRTQILTIAVLYALLPFAAAAQPAVQSQEGIALENQILQLQSQVQQLQNGGGNGGSSLGGGSQSAPPSGGDTSAPPSSIVTSLLNQVQQMQAQIQTLNGQVDTLQNQVNTQHDATEKEIGDLNFKVTGSATPGAAPPSAAPPGATPPGAAPPATPTLTPPGATPLQGVTSGGPEAPKAALHAAQQAIIHGDYATAQTEAEVVIAAQKATPQGYQAQYIRAQALLGQNKPQDSAIAFDDVYNRNRTGAYAPGSLLGLANSLTAIHQQAAACDTLASLNSQFPTPPKYLVTAIGDAGKRAHCN